MTKKPKKTVSDAKDYAIMIRVKQPVEDWLKAQAEIEHRTIAGQVLHIILTAYDKEESIK